MVIRSGLKHRGLIAIKGSRLEFVVCAHRDGDRSDIGARIAKIGGESRVGYRVLGDHAGEHRNDEGDAILAVRAGPAVVADTGTVGGAVAMSSARRRRLTEGETIGTIVVFRAVITFGPAPLCTADAISGRSVAISVAVAGDRRVTKRLAIRVVKVVRTVVTRGAIPAEDALALAGARIARTVAVAGDRRIAVGLAIGAVVVGGTAAAIGAGPADITVALSGRGVARSMATAGCCWVTIMLAIGAIVVGCAYFAVGSCKLLAAHAMPIIRRAAAAVVARLSGGTEGVAIGAIPRWLALGACFTGELRIAGARPVNSAGSVIVACRGITIDGAIRAKVVVHTFFAFDALEVACADALARRTTRPMAVAGRGRIASLVALGSKMTGNAFIAACALEIRVANALGAQLGTRAMSVAGLFVLAENITVWTIVVGGASDFGHLEETESGSRDAAGRGRGQKAEGHRIGGACIDREPVLRPSGVTVRA